jgi:predicted small metal-binding protein
MLHATAVDLDDEAPAELHFSTRQRRAKIDPTPRAYNGRIHHEREFPMAKQITCECGAVVRGETDDEVMSGARDHMRADHPELLSKVSDADLQGWIEEV